MIVKNKKLERMRRKYKAKNIFFYEPQIYFDTINLLRERLEDLDSVMSGVSFFEKQILLLKEVYKQSEYAELLVYKLTDEGREDVGFQDDLFGECADDLVDTLPLLNKESVGTMITGDDNVLDNFLKDLQEKISQKTKGISEIGNDLYHILKRSY